MKILSGQMITMLMVGTILIWLLGGMVNVMDVDAAQYAALAMEMEQNGSYLQLLEDGNDYLDKPPLLFWTAAISMKIFGYNALAYKLPSILFALLAVLAVFGFTKTYYNENAARLAALILATSQAVFLITNDVRTDTLLTGATALAIWQYSVYLLNNKWKHLLWGSIGVGLAMLAKGPIGLIVPAMALGTHAVVRNEWGYIFKWQWLISLVIIAIILAPMCVGLYQQFGGEGLEFYFWTQSFGRITGENKWSDDSTYFFFTHTYLWAFLPWSIISLPALWQKIKTAFTSFGKKSGPELISLGGVILPFVALSFSQYKLPHYIFVIFPMASVITGVYLHDLFAKNRVGILKALSGIQVGVSAIMLLLVVLAFLPFGPPNALLISVLGILVFVLILTIRNGWSMFQTRMIVVPIVCILMANLMASGHFYPALLKYQAASEAGRFFRDHPFGPERCYHLKEHRHSLCFEAHRVVRDLYNMDITRSTAEEKGPLMVYTSAEGKAELEASGLKINILKELDHFSVATLSMQFLVPSSREEELQKKYLIEVSTQ